MRDDPNYAAKSNARIKSSRAAQTIKAARLGVVTKYLSAGLCLLIILSAALLTSACGLARSQAVNANQQNTDARIVAETHANASAPVDDDYEASRRGAADLNNEPRPPANLPAQDKAPARAQIRAALLRNKLIGESTSGEIGGYKVVHFSHTCNLAVDNKLFYVIELEGIQQLAAFARGDAHTLIFDESFKLVQNLSAPKPLFCEGNRLFFNDYKMTTFYGEPEKQVKGNVLIFSHNATEIAGKQANLNFYKFKDLIR